MKNPIFISREVEDMLGTSISPGDILAYSSKQSMRIAVYLGILENKKGRQSVALYLTNKEDSTELIDGHLITIPIDEPLQHLGVATIIIVKGILLHPEFHVNNKLVQNAMKVVDDFKDEGVLE